MGAMDDEIDEYLSHLEHSTRKDFSGFTFYEGNLHGKEIVVSKSGVGKVFAAMTAQKLIDTYNPSYFIFTGIAGALNQTLEVGDIVIAEDSIQHDLNVTALGFDIGTIPYTDYRIFNSDITLRDLALTTPTTHKLFKGRVLTGDQFIVEKNSPHLTYLTKHLKGDVIEMEGASVAQVCTINNVPFLIIRTVSDNADNSATISFNEFLPIASKNSFDVINHIIKNINNENR